MSVKIYISGIFAKAEKELQLNGFETVNPMTLNHNQDQSFANKKQTAN